MKFKHVLATLALSLSVGVGVFAGVKANNIQQASAATRTVGFLNTAGWPGVKAYMWGDSGNNTWPGVAATDTGKTESTYKIYSVSITEDSYNKLIFNNSSNDSQKTADLDIPGANNYVYDFGNNGWAKPHSWGLCGSFNEADWADDTQTANTVPMTATSATFTVVLKAGDTFKFRADSAWTLQLDGNNISGQNSTYFTTEGAGEHPNALMAKHLGRCLVMAAVGLGTLFMQMVSLWRKTQIISVKLKF